MTKQFQGKSGKIYEVFEKKIAGGGEGSIHEIQGDEGLVAKIFKAGRTSPEREEKLLLMMEKKLSADELFQVAWPQDVIYERGVFAGYIMPKIREASSLTELYSDEEYNLNHRLIVAYNLAGAVDTVHQMGQVVGDFNPQNICVRLKGNDKFKVTLVDTDSYHITADGKTYRCEVGRGEYIAPELQKKLGGNVTLKMVSLPSYTKETDLFALAVHIFQLLMNGCHPFACAKEINLQQENISRMTGSKYADSVVAPQPVENIKTGFWAIYKTKPGFAAPPYAPAFWSLPKLLREKFVQTFQEGFISPSRRVTALEWQKALIQYKENTRQCLRKHFYFDHLAKCPLCEAEERWKDVLQKVSDSQINPKPDSVPEPLNPNPPVVHINTFESKENWEHIQEINEQENDFSEKEQKRKARSVLIAVAVLCLFIVGIFLYNKYINVNSYSGLLERAEADIESGDYDSAVQHCEDAKKAIGADSVSSKKKLYYLEGKAWYEKELEGKALCGTESLEHAQEILKTGQNEPEDVLVDSEYELLLQKAEYLSKIKEYYRLCISLIESYIVEEMYSEAINECNEAINKDYASNDVSKKQLYYLKGKALYKKGDLDDALSVLCTGEHEPDDINFDNQDYEDLMQVIVPKS